MWKTNVRWIPKRYGVLIILVWVAGFSLYFLDLSWSGFPRQELAGLPFLLLIGYVLFGVALNRTCLNLAEGWLSVQSGPVPLLAGGRRIAVLSIRQVTYWKVIVPTRFGARAVWSVGVALDGEVVPVVGDRPTSEEAAKLATELASKLGTGPVFEIVRPLPVKRWRAARRLIIWASVFCITLLGCAWFSR